MGAGFVIGKESNGGRITLDGRISGELVGLHYFLFLFSFLLSPYGQWPSICNLADFRRPEFSFTCRNLPGLAYDSVVWNRRLRCVMIMKDFEMPNAVGKKEVEKGEPCLKHEPCDPFVFLWTSNPSKQARSALQRILGCTLARPRL
jgi:hypothetical protein